MRKLAWLAIILWGCGQGGGDDGAGDDAPGGGGTVREKARKLVHDLRGYDTFLIGVGNDNTGPFDHQVPIELHYAYLVGYGDRGGWPTWNAGGAYVSNFATSDRDHGVTPMFTYYQLALELENQNDAVLTDATRMHQYLADVRLMFQKLAETGLPAVVTFEPDYFGYLMQRADQGRPPTAIATRIHFDDTPECAALAETAEGLTRCVTAIARAEAPKVKIGFHASAWGAWYDDTDPNADVAGSGRKVGDFLRSVGADGTDFVAVETLDRDAGFWETNGGGATCSTSGGPRGSVYWDEANVAYPNFHQHLAWVKALTDEAGLPAVWWQTPMGRPSAACGGSDQHWRDDRVHYFFGHVQELIDAGGAGMTFGTGAAGQTNLGTDGDQLRDAATAYRAAPVTI